MKRIVLISLVVLFAISCECGCTSKEDLPQKKVFIKVKTVDGQWADRSLVWTIPQDATLSIRTEKGSYWLAYHLKGHGYTRMRNAVIDYKVVKQINEVQKEELK